MTVRAPRTPNSMSSKEMALLLGQSLTDIDDLNGRLSNLQQTIDTIITNPAVVVVPPSVNQLYNGSYSHSFASWNDTGATNDTNLSCYPWYSHPVEDNQPMVIGSASAGTATLAFTSANVNTGSDYLEFSDPHWIKTGTALTVSGSGQPAPLAISTVYYAIALTTTRLQFAATYADALAGTEIDLTTTGSGAAKTVDYNYTLKESNSSIYVSEFSDWDWPTGTARLNGDTDVSTWFSPLTVDPSYSFYAGITAVKRNAYITCGSEVRIAVGLYNNELIPDEIFVANGGTASSNGTYTYDSEVNGKPKYILGANYIQWDLIGNWQLFDDTVGAVTYVSTDNTAYPVDIGWSTVFGVGTDPHIDVTASTQWDWVTGPFEVTAEVVGTVGTPTSRDYVVHAITDRGFTVQSTALTVANAPSDADFAGGARVVLSWPQVLNYGITSYDIYRKTGATYKLLVAIATGQLQYIDNNSSTAAAGYPSYTFNQLTAFTATQQGTLQLLSYSGDPLVNQWGTIPYAIRVPFNYNKGRTVLEDKYWLRFYITGQNANGRLDLQVTDGFLEMGNAEVTSAAGQFSSTDPDMVGLDITVTDADGNTLTSTITTVNSAGSIEMADVWPYDEAADCTVYIEGGAPSHPLLMDLAFLDYRAGTGFAPNNEDISPARGIPPVVPNGSTQGGSGSGGTGDDDGGVHCLFSEENVLTDGGVVLAKDLTKGTVLVFNGKKKRIEKVEHHVSPVWYIECENGASLRCTLSKCIFVEIGKKIPLSNLTTGDEVLTCIDGEVVPSKIAIKAKILNRGIVVQIGLVPDEYFLAGQNGYIVVSNNKPVLL